MLDAIRRDHRISLHKVRIAIDFIKEELTSDHPLAYHKKQLYEQMHDRWNTWFPALRDRVAFGRQCANLWQVKAWMHHHIVERLGGYQAPCQIIDTLPVPICQLETDGLDLFVEEYGQLINVSKAGQLVLRELLQAHLQRIDRDSAGYALRLYPFTRKRLQLMEEPKAIVIGPSHIFWSPGC